MKAAHLSSYGSDFKIEEAEEPKLKTGQLLVNNRSASINVMDLKIRSGMMKDRMPLNFPVTLGGDFSGVIAEVSAEITDFKPGDEIYGYATILNGGSGSFAEKLIANAANSGIKPTNISFEEASALPLVGVSALQALEDHIKLQPGQKILIQGGAGGIGHIAIQLAKALGANVVTTVSKDDFDFVKNLGADEAIDYHTINYSELPKDFDAVFDTVGGETRDKSLEVIKDGGVLVSMLGTPEKEIMDKHNCICIGQMTVTDTSHLNKLKKLVEDGKIKINIDKVFLFEQINEAVGHQEKDHPRGKVVIKIK